MYSLVSTSLNCLNTLLLKKGVPNWASIIQFLSLELLYRKGNHNVKIKFKLIEN